ncbi:hypothetical protein ACFVH9_07420 [Streptomyces hirsutus]|uniref:hypothetical protein n=1 Tax=Streptomyces hirsutus TaxID=35620 RepID=UPI003640A3F9
MAGEDVDYGSARITIDIDDGNADSESRAAGARIQRALLRATRRIGEQMRRQIQRGLSAAAVTVRVEPDLSRFDAQLLTGLRSLTSIDIPVAPDVTGFETQLRALLAGIEVPIRVVPDLDGFDARIRAHSAPRITVGVDIDGDPLTRALSSLGAVAGRIGGVITGALRFGLIGIAAAGAATAIGKLVVALAPAAGLLAALPAVVLGGVAAMGALKLALAGVGDAFKLALTGGSKEFEASLKDLSPKAKAAAREVRALKPAFEELRNSVQDGFFTQIEGQITATATALRGPLLALLTNIGSAWGGAARNALGYVQGARGVANVESIMGAAQAAVGGFAQTTNRLTAGLLQVAAVVSDRFGAELGGGIEALGQRFGNWLLKIAQGGQAVAWVEGAITTLAQFGDLAGNVSDIIGGMFRAGEGAGAGVLTNLQNITAAVAEFVNSTQGQDALGNIFGTIGTVAAQLGPIIGALLANLGQIAPALAPIFTGLGPVIVGVINQIGQAVQGALPQLQVAFAQLGIAIVQLGPALPPLAAAAAALARSAADLAVALAPAVALLVQAVAPVANFAAPLLVAAAATLGLVKAIKMTVAVFRVLQAAWLALNVAFVANPIGLIIIAVIGLVAAIYLLYQRFEVVRNVVDAVGRALRDGFLAAVDFVKSASLKIAEFFVSAFNSAKSAVSSGIDAVVSFFTGLPGKITSGLSSLGSSIGNFFVSSFETAKAGLTIAVQAVVDFFVALPGRIVAGLAALPGLLLDVFTSAVAFLIIGILTVIAGVVFVFTELPGRILNALISLGTFLLNAFVTGFTLVTTKAGEWITATVAFFTALPGRILNALISLGAFLVNAFVTGFNVTRAKVTEWITATVAFFRSLPGRIGSAVSSLSSSLMRNFSSAFSAAKSRTTTFISEAVQFFRGLPGKIASAVSTLAGKLSSAFSTAAGKARSAVSSLISGVVSLFRELPGKIMSAIGDIGGQIMRKVKSGLPSAVRKYLPFANGGIVYGPTRALIGEAGPEVVIPLTRPKRAAQLAERSGLLAMLGMQQARLLATASTTTAGGGASANAAVASLRGALSGIAGLLDNIGVSAVQGMVAGIRDNAGLVVAAVENMAGSAVLAAEETLEIASPSKVFARIGKAVGAGFIKGLTGTAAEIKSTTEKLAKQITDAFKGKKTKVDDRLVAMLASGNKRLQALAKQREFMAKRIDDAIKFATETYDSTMGAFSLQNLTQGEEVVNTKTITAGLEDALKRVKKFNADIVKLTKFGLRKDLLRDIIGMGPEKGAEMARMLASSSRESLKRINRLQRDLSESTTTFSETSADVLYDLGKDAGKGFLAGLAGQQKEIEKLMLRIAKAMQKSIRKALEIRSPSHVMRRIGELAGAGLHIGLVRRMSVLAAAAGSAARDMVRGVSSELSGMAGLGSAFDDGNVVPLTRSQRLRRTSAGGAAPAGSARGGAGGGVVHNHHWEIREVGDAHVTAQRVVNRFVLAAGVSG